MNSEYKDFIAIYRDVYPEGYCEHLINEFDRLSQSGAGYSRKQSENEVKHRKNDFQLGLNFGVHTVANFENQSVTKLFFDGLQKCYELYTEEFSILKNDKISATAMKLQEQILAAGIIFGIANKEAVFMLTEFLYTCCISTH